MDDPQEIAIAMVEGEPRIDSRLVAKSLGIEHRSFFRVLTSYSADLEELGILRFEIALKSGPQRGPRDAQRAMTSSKQ